MRIALSPLRIHSYPLGTGFVDRDESAALRRVKSREKTAANIADTSLRFAFIANTIAHPDKTSSLSGWLFHRKSSTSN